MTESIDSDGQESLQNAPVNTGSRAIFKAVGAGAGTGVVIGVVIAGLVNRRWTADAEADISQQLHHLLNRANAAGERLRRLRK